MMFPFKDYVYLIWVFMILIEFLIKIQQRRVNGSLVLTKKDTWVVCWFDFGQSSFMPILTLCHSQDICLGLKILSPPTIQTCRNEN